MRSYLSWLVTIARRRRLVLEAAGQPATPVGSTRRWRTPGQVRSSLSARWRLVTFGFALAACGASVDVSSVQQPVIGGDPDAGHPEVLAIFVQPALSTGVGFCTGFLIAPNLVMTARHCVSDMDSNGLVCADETVGGTRYQATRALGPAAAARFTVIREGNVDTLTSQSEFLKLSAVHVPPHVSGFPNCGADVALLELKAPITDLSVRALRETPARVGERFSTVGYGYDGAEPASDGLRRSRSGLSAVSVGERRDVDGLIYATANDWIADTGPCGGDSGAPALDERGEVIGVMSRGDRRACVSMVYTQVSSFRDWARETVIAAAGRANIAVTAWVSQPPSHTDAGVTVDGGAELRMPIRVPSASIEGPVASGCSAFPGSLASCAILWCAHRRARRRYGEVVAAEGRP